MSKGFKVEFDIEKVEEYILSMNPYFDIIPLKVTFSFSSFSPLDLEKLKELANVENGIIERWILVPDSCSLGILKYIIQRAFGLNPNVFYSYFTLPSNEVNRSFSSLSDMLSCCGSIFDNPEDVGYEMMLEEESLDDKNMIPPLSVAMYSTPFEWKKVQEMLEAELSDILKDGLLYEGKKVKVEELPPSLSLLQGKTKTKDFEWSEKLCENLEIRDVLLSPQQRYTDVKKRPKEIRQSHVKRYKRAIPFTREIYLECETKDEAGFEFKVEKLENIYSLFEDDLLTVDEYFESCQYVTRTERADCIYKNGYDLFGVSPEFYYLILLGWHQKSGLLLEDNKTIYQHLKDLGWREPYMDLKKVLR